MATPNPFQGRYLHRLTTQRSLSFTEEDTIELKLNDDQKQGSTSCSWPLSSRYYNPLLMDANHLTRLMKEDTSYAKSYGHCYLPWYMAYTYLRGTEGKKYNVLENEDHARGVFGPFVLDSKFTIVHVRQKRQYLTGRTTCALSIDESMWAAVLDRFEILPTFLELLHSNNGGTLVQTSYADFDAGVEPAAFHIGYKMGDWANCEVAIYARVDLKTDSSFMLLMGTDDCIEFDQICNLLQTKPDASVFHVVYALHTICLNMTEKVRWTVDHETQKLEGLTGVASCLQQDASPLSAEELEFNKSHQVTTDFARLLEFGSTRVRMNFEALLHHMDQYKLICPVNGAHRLSDARLQNLREACQMKLALARNQFDQIQGLRFRLSSQSEVTKTLMAQRDTEITLDIAQATRRDSELMRVIAAITMIFLPATFVATFFSMVFFHVGDEKSIRLMVDKTIWLYPVVAVPLTIGAAVAYSVWSWGWSWRDVLGPSRRQDREPDLAMNTLGAAARPHYFVHSDERIAV